MKPPLPFLHVSFTKCSYGLSRHLYCIIEVSVDLLSPCVISGFVGTLHASRASSGHWFPYSTCMYALTLNARENPVCALGTTVLCCSPCCCAACAWRPLQQTLRW